MWTPPAELSARLGDKTQEHCTVYNMMRLADWLLRWTGDPSYADYWERNLYNGILAQQHPDTGMVAYFLPLQAGAVKKWGTPTDDFWCCHGTLVEAHAVHGRGVYFEDGDGLAVGQYIPSELAWERAGVRVCVTQAIDPQTAQARRPQSLAITLRIACQRPVEFALTLRLPWWLQGEPAIAVNGRRQPGPFTASSWYCIRRTWADDTVSITLPLGLTAAPLPDNPTTMAFMDGPVVLAGLCDEERELQGDKDSPQTLLVPHNEREWAYWRPGYRTHGQQRNVRFLPLYEVRDERYTVYFPVQGAH